jgi:hypothetical protein
MYIAALDIGSARIKAVFGEKRRNDTVLLSFKTVDYPNSLFTDPHYDGRLLPRSYEINKVALSQALEKIVEDLPPETHYYFTFNSLFASIYHKAMSVTNMRSLHNAAGFFTRKLEESGRHAEYEIIGFDRRLGEGELLVYSYLEKPFNDLLEIIAELSLEVDVVDFDALCLCNALEEASGEHENHFLIDFGMTKTTLIGMKSGRLRHFNIFPRGLLSVYERMARRFNISIREAEDLLLAEDDQRMDIAEFTPTDFLEPYLAQVRKELAAAEPLPPVLLASGGFLNHEPFIALVETALNTRIKLFDPFPKNIELKHRTPYIIAFGLLLR